VTIFINGRKLLQTAKFRSERLLSALEKPLLVLFLLLSVEFFSYHLYFSNKIIPGVSLEKLGTAVNMSGKTYGQVLETVTQDFEDFSREPLTITIGGSRSSTTLDELGINPEATKSAKSLYLIGRSRNLLSDLITEYKAMFSGITVPLEYSVDEAKFGTFITNITSQLSTQDAAFTIKDGKFAVVPSKEGLSFSAKELSENVLSSIKSLNREVTVDAVQTKPKLSTADLEILRPKLASLYLSRPVFYYGGETWTISDEEFLRVFDLMKSTPERLVVFPEGVSALSTRVSQEIDVTSKAISFQAEGDKITSFEGGADGFAVDQPSFKILMAENTLAGSLSKILIPVNRVHPDIGANGYGIKELIGEGVSNFAGSIPGRVHNIKIASTKLNGVLIPPGKDFSFNEAVGEVSARTGYDYAYIISEGRTVLGTGGGLCQVSTTVFRAALNSGLPILKRTAHAYRVHYYEEGGSPVGFDATVFSPSVDLQFKNDTGNYILVQSVFENEKDTLIFRFYGTKDGRTVKIDGPVILSSSPPPPTLYQDDPTLPKGTIKQVDFAAGGMTVYFKRLVERNGEKLTEDTFYSRYQPWRAIYLVGTKE